VVWFAFGLSNLYECKKYAIRRMGWIIRIKYCNSAYFIFLKDYSIYLNDNQLIVKSTWVVYERIDISKITKIEKTNSILSSPALSLDRIRIRYNKYDEVLISPKVKKEFVDELLKVNPTIEIIV
jgi:hypothetical protein